MYVCACVCVVLVGMEIFWGIVREAFSRGGFEFLIEEWKRLMEIVEWDVDGALMNLQYLWDVWSIEIAFFGWENVIYRRWKFDF